MTPIPQSFSVSIPDEVAHARDLLREADFGDQWLLNNGVAALAKFAAALKKAGDQQPKMELLRLWALCLQAEILDYYAHYTPALAVLEVDGKRLADGLKERDGTLSDHKPLLRQELWTVIFYSHTYYRNELYLKAEDLLLSVRKELDRRLPVGQDEPSFGLRAKVAYSLGQIYRQTGNVLAARREFLSSLEFTRKRLEAKLAKYQGRQFDIVREQKYANYVTAKIFSFGLTWAANNEGALQRARGSATAGVILLLCTRDMVHTAYAKVMYAQILRSLAAPARSVASPADLEEALSLLKPLADPATSSLKTVPRFLMRARYEYARALHLAGRIAEAEKLARDLHDRSKTGTRHFIAAGVLLVRILADAGRLEDAISVSLRLVEAGKHTIQGPMRAEIMVSRAELLMKLTEPDFVEIDQCLLQAENLSKENPVSRAVCRLHRARWYGLQGRLDEARRQLIAWDRGAHIESGLLQQMATDIKLEIESLDTKLQITIDHLEGEQFDGVLKMVRRWAIRSLYAKFGKDYLQEDHVQSLLGLGSAAVKNWQRDLDYDPRRSK